MFEFKEERGEVLKGVCPPRPCCGNCRYWDWPGERCGEEKKLKKGEREYDGSET